MDVRLRSLLGASVLLAAVLVLISLNLEGAPADGARAASEPAEAAARVSPGPFADPVDPAYEPAARALRERRCGDAQQALEPLLEHPAGSEGARFARLVSGLYAHACEDVALAQERLAAAAEPGAVLEDWRLYLLAQSAHAREEEGVAESALAELLADHRGSPLWERSLVAAIEQSTEAGDSDHALELIRWSREQDDLSPATVARAEALAWEIGQERRDLTLRTQAARRLLTYAPMTASELGVVEMFRRPTGEIAWRAILSGPELERRAEALLDSSLASGAALTLADVPADERSFEWTLLQARALTESGQGREAVRVLRAAVPADAEERVAVDWALARAYADLAAPLAGGARLSADEREDMRRASRDHLMRVVRQGGDRELAGEALRRLFADRVAEEHYEEAVQALRALRRLEPQDTTGSSYLWGLGWQEYRKQNYTGAIGYWTELTTLYPETRDARSGHYWTGRAFERLGHQSRAREVFADIVASDTTDFYRRQAVERVAGSASAADTEAPPEQPWPVDADLDRARLLTDVGLDDLALAEIEARGERTDRRARNALTGVAFARQGRYRTAIPHLRRAFPALGGPYQSSVPVEARRLYYPLAFEDDIRAAAQRADVAPSLVYGIIRQESAFDITAMSHVGARGLMQLMPATGREVANRLGLGFSDAQLDEPAYNVRLGAAYFGQLMDMFDGRTELALAGYNGGPYRIKRLWREAGPSAEIDYFMESLPIEESRSYVKWVLLFSDSYSQMYGM